MKFAKRIWMIVCVVAVLSAHSTHTFGMGFDAEKAYESVFVIHSGNALGSGFSIGENCIITNAHVLEKTDSIQISSYSGEKYEAYIVSMDTEADIAILGVNDVNFTPLKTSSDYTVGDDVYAIGAPNSLAYTLTKGVISSKERKTGSQTYIQTDAAINSGNSGGPLLNDAGEVIGVNSYKMSDSEGIGLAIPISTVIQYMSNEKIETNESGNVTETIKQPSTKSGDSLPSSDSKAEKNSKNFSILTFVLGVSLGISVLLNIILIILLVFRKNKNIDYKPDPAERTDFEIELLE